MLLWDSGSIPLFIVTNFLSTELSLGIVQLNLTAENKSC
uniref:Uncharacterized protein n=1 Tax=Arundo donax TaxID=35708 RepID=A0A0A9FKU5_ARUDO